jgi:hypothetical protein
MNPTRLGVLAAGCILSVAAMMAGAGSSPGAEDKIGAVTLPPGSTAAPAVGRPVRFPVLLYGDGLLRAPYAVTGWMGKKENFKMELNALDGPHTGRTCIRIDYTATAEYGGVVWQDPANDWGDKAGGYNLTGAKYLAFWARGAEGGEKVTFGYGIIGGDKKFHDSSSGKIDAVLSKEWRLFAIPLADKDLKDIKSGFYWNYVANGKAAKFYIDDVEYVAVDIPPALLAAPPTPADKPAASKFPFAIYEDWSATPTYAPTGRFGPIGTIIMNLKCPDDPHGGKTCIKVEFTAKTGRGGAVWVDPPGDMGDRPGGQNMKGAGAISFWARGAKGGEKVSFGYGYIGSSKKYFDSSMDLLRDVELTAEWKEYTIPLDGKDVTQIKSAFYWQAEAQPTPVVFYLDDIVWTGGGTSSTPATTPTTPTTPASPATNPTGPAPANPGVKVAALPLPVVGKDGEGAFEPTGWLGDGKAMTYEGKSAESPHSGKTCVKIDFKGSADKLAGIVWQNPRNNWGTLPGGYNLAGAKSLTFWARGTAGGEKINFGYGMITKEKQYSDSSTATLKSVTLSKDWQQFTIPLAGRDMSCIISGFFWTAVDPTKPLTFFLDDIEYTADAK